jgi:hypothetical protein
MGHFVLCLEIARKSKDKSKTISKGMAKLLTDKAEEFRKKDDALNAQGAMALAAQWQMKDLEAERADIVQQIEAAGGVVPKPEPEPAPEPTPEPAQEPAPAPEIVPRETPEAQQETPEEAKAADLARRIQDNAGALRTMAGEAGWAEIGGRIIRDPDTGEVTGRSKWIPKAEWWPGKPEGMTEVDFRKAVDKAIAGKPLGDRQRLGVEYALKYLEDMEAEAQKAGMDLGEVSEIADDVADAAEDEIGDIPWDSVDTPKRIDAALEKIDWEAMYGRDEAQESSGRAEETPAEPATESAQASEGEAEAPAGQEVAPEITLEQQSEADLAALEREQKAAEDKRVAEEKAAEDKRRADAESEDFALTGSSRQADANPNQGDLLATPAPKPDADAGIKRVNKISSNELSRYQVDAKVFDENSGKYVTEKVRADEAWKALRTDIAMMKQLLNCIRGG